MGSESVTVLQDFSLGLNTLTVANRLDQKEFPTATNVWNDNGAIAKRLGQSRTSTSLTIFGNSWYGQSVHSSVLSAVERLVILVDAGKSRNFIIDSNNAITILLSDTAGTGTAATTSGSAVVTGSGTNWATVAKAGALFSANAGTVSADTIQILTVDSDTQLTLTANFPTTYSGISYKIVPSWAPTNRVSYADINLNTYICGQGSVPILWNGSFAAYVPAFPQASYSINFRNYIFAAGTVANPSRVAWSALKDAASWPASNFIDVTPDDGFQIVGLVTDGQSIVIFKTNGAYKLSGDVFDPANPTYTLTQIYTPSDFAINSPRTFQLFGPSGYLMAGNKGFYSYDGGGAISKIFDYDRIRADFADMGTFDWAVAPSVSAEPSAIIVDGNYWLQVPNRVSSISTTHKEFTYILDKTGSVWKWTTLAGGMISDFAYRAGTLYGVNSYTSGTAGAIMQLNTGSTDGLASAINGSFTTKILEFGNQQRFGLVFVYLKKQSAGDLTFEYSIDEGSFVSNTIDMTTGTGTRIKSAPIVIGRIGRSVQFRLSNNTVAQTFEVYGIELHHQELRR